MDRCPPKAYFFWKRVFDIIFAMIGIFLTAPIWIVAVIGIEISDRGPVFYRANRIGKNNEPFRMFKFRSMRVDLKANENNFKADATRIFKWGLIMRNTKIDELPQLINILCGDMSFVGPRPASADQVAVVRAGEYMAVSKVKPGLTGPAALYDYIYGDSIEDEEEYREKVLPTRMGLDLQYIKRMNAFFDLKMIWYTIICIILSVIKGNKQKILDELIAYKNN